MRRVYRAVGIVVTLAPLLSLLGPRGGETVPLYAARNGLQCQTCHFDPNGGGPRNEFGFAFARNRHAIVPEGEGSPWADLMLTNRVGEAMPVYLGVNQRFMLLGNASARPDSLDRLGFFDMENALHVTFQPHPRLSLIYTRGGRDAVARNADAFGILGGLPGGGYLKAGRFRNPFGLRMDDHTVAGRNGFLDFSSMERFLPYDPRQPDMGLEYGMEHAGWFGRVAWTNGGTHPFGSNPYAETKSAKLGYAAPSYQGAVSFYDDFHAEPVFDPGSGRFLSLPTRATRWGSYGMTRHGPLALIGEVAAGTDLRTDGAEVNRLAYWVELDYAPARQWNLRVRYDHLELDRASDPAARRAATHDRYALEGEYVPVPFAELRLTVRRIVHRDQRRFGYDDETQGYLQFHWSY